MTQNQLMQIIANQREYKRKLEARVEELEKAQEWHDISEPPEDGRHVLLWREDITFVGWRVEILGETRYVINAPGLPILFPPPTRWRNMPPLPEAPHD